MKVWSLGLSRLLGYLVLTVVMLGAALPAMAQDPAPDPTKFRPLGRFVLDGSIVDYHPNGYYVLVLDSVNGTSYIALWDERFGERLWRVSLPSRRERRTLTFSPTGETILMESYVYPPDELETVQEIQETLLTVYDTETGYVVSQSGDIDIIDIDPIPGDMRQDLSAEPFYSVDGQEILVTYRRRAEATRCGVWSMETLDLLWQQTNPCGTLNPDGTLMVRARPHENPYSSYRQLELYDLRSGESVAVLDEEVSEFSWIDDRIIMANRPYGDAPVVWHVDTNEVVVVEQPFRLLGTFLRVVGDYMYTTRGDYTYVWDKNTGKYSYRIEVVGQVVNQGDRILILTYPEDWRYLEFEERADIFVAYDFATGNELWSTRWQHGGLYFSPDRQLALAHDEFNNTMDIFDLNTGNQTGSRPFSSTEYYVTPDWNWLFELSGYTYTVWGDESFLGEVPNPPNAVTAAEIDLLYEPNRRYARAATLPAEVYLWVDGRQADNSYYRIVLANGSVYWIEPADVDLFISVDDIEIRE